jgi:hypothetical protein
MGKMRYLLPLVLVTGFLVLPASVSANSPAGTISFAGNATLLVSPGPVDVTVHYSCLPSTGFAGVAVRLDENGVEGGTVVPATCDGQNHSVTVVVDGLFTPGTAVGTAQVFNDAVFITTQEQVFIK